MSRGHNNNLFIDNLRCKSILITGVSGQIGSALAAYLSGLNRSHGLALKIYGQTRDISDSKLSELLPEVLELVESPLENLQERLSITRLDYIVHLASPTASLYFVTKPVETIDSIINGTRGVLEYAMNFEDRPTVLYVSSMEVYGDVPKQLQPITEDVLGNLDLSNPRSSYPMAKRLAEHLSLCYATEYGLPVKIARPCQTFGGKVALSDQRVYAQIARSVKAGQPVILNTPGEQSHCFCETEDMVRGLLFVLLLGEEKGIYNIANPDTYCSIRQMAEQVCDHFKTGSEVRIKLDPSRGYPPTTHLKLDTHKIQALGWQPQKDLMEMYESIMDTLV